MMESLIQKYLKQILKVEDQDTLKALTAETLAEMGFGAFSYIGFNAPKTENGYYINTTFVQSTYNERWVKHYVQKDLLYTDPIIQKARASLLPFYWDAEKALKIETQAKKTFFRDSARFGIHRGAVVPIHAPGGEFAIFAMVFDGTAQELKKAWPAIKDDLYLLGTYYHAAVFDRILKRKVEPIPLLSPRELQTLQWAARGKTLWETAQIMGISEGTAKSYLKVVMRKLETSNKTHAVSKALRHGLINV